MSVYLQPLYFEIPDEPVGPTLEGVDQIRNQQQVEDQIIGKVSPEVEEELRGIASTVSSIVVSRNGGVINRCAAFTTGIISLDGLAYNVHQSAAHCFDGISADSLATIEGTTVAMNGNLLKQSYLAADRRVGSKSQFDSAQLFVPSVGIDDSEMPYVTVDAKLLDALIKDQITVWQIGFPESAQKPDQSVMQRQIRAMNLCSYQTLGNNIQMLFRQADNRKSTVQGDKGYSGGPLFYFNEFGEPVVIATTYAVTHYEGQDDVLETVGISLMRQDQVVDFANDSNTDFFNLNWQESEITYKLSNELDEFQIYSGKYELPLMGASLMNVAGYTRDQAMHVLAALKLSYLNKTPDDVTIIVESPFRLLFRIKLVDGRQEFKMMYISYNSDGNTEVRIVNPDQKDEADLYSSMMERGNLRGVGL